MDNSTKTPQSTFQQPSTTSTDSSKLTVEHVSELIEVHVGPDKTKALINKQMVCERSEFFKAACQEHWESGRTKVITLDDQGPELFAIFHTWILTGNIENSPILIRLASKEDTVAREVSLEDQRMQLEQCYIMGDFLQAPGFKNAIIDMVLSNQEKYEKEFDKLAGATSEYVDYVFTNTVSGSLLRKIVVETASFAEKPTSRNADFLYDLAQLLMDNGGPPNESPWSKPRCTYHEHPDQAAGILVPIVQTKITTEVFIPPHTAASHGTLVTFLT